MIEAAPISAWNEIRRCEVPEKLPKDSALISSGSRDSKSGTIEVRCSSDIRLPE